MDERRWSVPARVMVVSALAIAMGSLFVTTYTLALGHPVPQRIEAAIVGNPASRLRVVDAVERVAGGGLRFHQYPSIAAARRAIDAQRVYAALDLTQPTPSLYIASAAGASVARVLERVSAADPRIRVVDTHPLPGWDPQGLDIFYLVVAATIVGFLTVFQVRANASGLRLPGWAAFVLTFALAESLVLTPVNRSTRTSSIRDTGRNCRTSRNAA